MLVIKKVFCVILPRLAVMLFAFTQLLFAQEYYRHIPEGVVSVGEGLNPNNPYQIKRLCKNHFDFNVIDTVQPKTGKATITVVRSRKQLLKAMQVNTYFDAQYAFTDISASAEYSRDIKESTNSITWVLHYFGVQKTDQLEMNGIRDNIRSRITDANGEYEISQVGSWLNACGPNIITEVQKGIQLSIIYTASNLTIEQQKILGIDADVEYSTVQVQANYNSVIKSLFESNKVSFEIISEGLSIANAISSIIKCTNLTTIQNTLGDLFQEMNPNDFIVLGYRSEPIKNLIWYIGPALTIEFKVSPVLEECAQKYRSASQRLDKIIDLRRIEDFFPGSFSDNTFAQLRNLENNIRAEKLFYWRTGREIISNPDTIIDFDHEYVRVPELPVIPIVIPDSGFTSVRVQDNQGAVMSTHLALIIEVPQYMRKERQPSTNQKYLNLTIELENSVMTCAGFYPDKGHPRVDDKPNQDYVECATLKDLNNRVNIIAHDMSNENITFPIQFDNDGLGVIKNLQANGRKIYIKISNRARKQMYNTTLPNQQEVKISYKWTIEN